MHEVLVNRLGGLSLPRKGVVRLTDRPDMTLDVYRGRKTTKQQATTSLQGGSLLRVCTGRSSDFPRDLRALLYVCYNMSPRCLTAAGLHKALFTGRSNDFPRDLRVFCPLLLYGQLKVNEIFLTGRKIHNKKKIILKESASGKTRIAMLLLNWLNLDWHCYSVRFHWSMCVSSSCMHVSAHCKFGARSFMSVAHDS